MKVTAKPCAERKRSLAVFGVVAREPDDPIRAELDVGNVLAQQRDARAVEIARVPALHRAQDAVGSGLRGERKEAVRLVAIGDRARERVGHVRGVQRDQPDARESFDFLQAVDQVREAWPSLATESARLARAGYLEVLAVAVDRLPEQRDHFHALLDEAAPRARCSIG